MNNNLKTFNSPNYNFVFDKNSGFFMRWGKTLDDDPQFSEFGPEILDIEISSGQCSQSCQYCYKNNGMHNQTTTNLTLDQFKTILNKLPKTLTQIAFGITDIDTNPDMWKMFEYARELDIIPNYTTNGFNVTDEIAEKTAKLCGAVAVSNCSKDLCYNAVEKFIKAGIKQVNIHALLSEETYQKCLDLIDDTKTDPRLKNLNAIVFLQYKPKNPKCNYSPLTNKEKIKTLIQKCLENNVGFGFDSCFANRFLEIIKENKELENLEILTEPCESSLFSSYINAKGQFFPCSFLEGIEDWKEGLDVLNCSDFLTDIWNHQKTTEFKNKLISNCRNCPIYNH